MDAEKSRRLQKQIKSTDGFLFCNSKIGSSIWLLNAKITREPWQWQHAVLCWIAKYWKLISTLDAVFLHFFKNGIKVVKCSSERLDTPKNMTLFSGAVTIGLHMEAADLPVSHCQYFWLILVDSCDLQLCRRSLKRSTVGQQTCGALLSCSGSWWPERCHLLTCLTWKLAWRWAWFILILLPKLTTS